MRGAEKHVFGKETITTDPFQLKIMLDTDDPVAVYSEKDLSNTKIVKLQKMTNFGDSLRPKYPKH